MCSSDLADGYRAISLSVDDQNPAVGLYQRHGFRKVREDDGAVVMRAELGSNHGM